MKGEKTNIFVFTYVKESGLSKQTGPIKAKPKLVQINEIVDDLKDTKHMTECDLIQAINSDDQQTQRTARRLFESVSWQLISNSLN